MDEEEIERLIVSVRADTRAFARDVEEMRQGLEGPLGAGADRAGRAIENALLRAVRTGTFGFEDLKRVALGVMDEIARSALRDGIASLGGGGSGGGGLAALTGLAMSLFGAPGRATGGPVSPGRPYLVGERGPELFVPASAGSVAATPAAAGPREVRVAITVNAAADTAPRALAQSSRQVARAVKAALAGAD
ncbi:MULTISPECIES: tail tape measure protein [unclassified Sphingomonas]|uniref:tail tape measure protein n=1 Tax=Sphingomonas TaxID=13687 RepID=UPI0009629474|nr:MULTISPECIES: tail tape measure protein [unclassified Sphingomonas]MBN8809797.1 tail tape measure protein [Sphingomonas sp.]OJY50421.1 MAG: tail tape measure protein [Sphingomonas sp. 67-41]